MAFQITGQTLLSLLVSHLRGPVSQDCRKEADRETDLLDNKHKDDV